MNIPEDKFLTVSLKAATWGAQAVRIMQAALQAVEPGSAVRGYLTREGNDLTVATRRYDLAEIRHVLLVSVGKAAAPMGQAAAAILGDALSKGIVVAKKTPSVQLPQLDVLQAAHPVPDERSVVAAHKVISMLHDLTPDDLVLFLISGGGSALLTAPVDGVSLKDVQVLTDLLLRSGANIHEINTLRKHLDYVKGGGLAKSAFPARVETFIISDVVGDDLDVIASGPTVPDPTTYAYAWEIVDKYDLRDSMPRVVQRRLLDGRAGKHTETPKPGDPVFEKVYNQIIASNLQAANAARQQAGLEGFKTQILSEPLLGEASQVGASLAAVLAQAPRGERPLCLIAGGETTVTIRGSGLGGRNQELALAAVRPLAALPGCGLIAMATDGEDGPTDAAGAVVTHETLGRANELGLDPDDFLARNDAYHFFQPLGDLLRFGPTQTNVNDLVLLFAY